MDKFEEAWKENRHVWESSKNLAKAMYLAGQQSRQAELDQAYEDIETFVQAHQRECDIKVQIANELKEKDKRIEELERSCISYKNQRDDNAQKLMVKSVHYNSIQEELAKLKDRLELAHHLATQSTWSSLKQLKKVVKALRGENANS